MNHCNNHLKLLNSIKEMLQREKEAWININGEIIKRILHLSMLSPREGGGGVGLIIYVIKIKSILLGISAID